MSTNLMNNARVAARLTPCESCHADANEPCRVPWGEGHTPRCCAGRGERPER